MIDAAELLDSYIDPLRAESTLAKVPVGDLLTVEERRQRSLSAACWHIRRSEFASAEQALEGLPIERPAAPGAESGRRFVRAYLATRSQSPDSAIRALEAETHAQKQGAHKWRKCSTLLYASTQDASALSRAVLSVGSESPHFLAYVADLLSERLDDLEPEALVVVRTSVAIFPARWRFALRRVVQDQRASSQVEAGKLLEVIGERPDIKLLRGVARRARRGTEAGSLGRTLTRRLADRVVIEDQGRVQLKVGAQIVLGSEIRRKVLRFCAS